jgi:hypothetical protein
MYVALLITPLLVPMYVVVVLNSPWILKCRHSDIYTRWQATSVKQATIYELLLRNDCLNSIH